MKNSDSKGQDMTRKPDLQQAIEEEVLSICRHMAMTTVEAPRSLHKDIGLDCGCAPSRRFWRWFR